MLDLKKAEERADQEGWIDADDLWNDANNCMNVFVDTKIIVFINTKNLK